MTVRQTGKKIDGTIYQIIKVVKKKVNDPKLKNLDSFLNPMIV
jgi:hypothetical protein